MAKQNELIGRPRFFVHADRRYGVPETLIPLTSICPWSAKTSTVNTMLGLTVGGPTRGVCKDSQDMSITYPPALICQVGFTKGFSLLRNSASVSGISSSKGEAGDSWVFFTNSAKGLLSVHRAVRPPFPWMCTKAAVPLPTGLVYPWYRLTNPVSCWSPGRCKYAIQCSPHHRRVPLDRLSILGSVCPDSVP